MTSLDLDADLALFDGKLQGLVVTCYENERPLQGLAGLLDWRFQGVISHCVRAGVISGKAGECAYVPVTKQGKTYHLILAGCGRSASPGARAQLPMDTLRQLQKNLSSLRLQQVGVSRADFGGVGEDYFQKNLKGVPLWIAP